MSKTHTSLAKGKEPSAPDVEGTAPDDGQGLRRIGIAVGRACDACGHTILLPDTTGSLTTIQLFKSANLNNLLLKFVNGTGEGQVALRALTIRATWKIGTKNVRLTPTLHTDFLQAPTLLTWMSQTLAFKAASGSRNV